jgi:hypothetical protein
MRVNTTACPVLDGDSGDDRHAAAAESAHGPRPLGRAPGAAAAAPQGRAAASKGPSGAAGSTSPSLAAAAEDSQTREQRAEVLGLLKRVRALASLPPPLLESLARQCSGAQFPGGSCLVGQGDFGDALVLVSAAATPTPRLVRLSSMHNSLFASSSLPAARVYIREWTFAVCSVDLQVFKIIICPFLSLFFCLLH